ncbi:MAG: putative lipid II flippase FtsW [Elusimicrobiota bacterium]
MRYRFVKKPGQQKQGLIRRLLSMKNFTQGIPPDPWLIGCVLGLLVFGWVMVYSSSALFAESRYHDQFFFLKKQILWSVLGGMGFIAASNIPLDSWQKTSKLFYALTCITLIIVFLTGPEIAGAKRWFRLGGFSFQPSELAKLTAVILTADYLDRRQSRIKDFKKGLLPLLLIQGFMLGLILIEPDLGTPVLIGSVLFVLLVLGGARWKHFFLLSLMVLPVFLIAIWKVKYRLLRLIAYMDPWADAKGAGYQLVQSLLALGSGGIFGKGLGSSQMKISNLPDCHTDFVFSILGEELGLIGTLVCAALFLFLCLRGLDIARKAPNYFSRMVAAGISLNIGFQAVINMGVACGLFPTKGMPLPFISFGGSSLLFTLISVGILARLSRQEYNLAKTK